MIRALLLTVTANSLDRLQVIQYQLGYTNTLYTFFELYANGHQT